MRILIIIAFTTIASFFGLKAQELNATIQVLHPTIQTSNQELFPNMQKAIENLINYTVWTEENYEIEERIKCSFVLTIDGANGNSYTGRLQVNYSRPIYNSGYDSPVLNYIDNDISFSYIENEPLEYVENQFVSNLSSIFSYYAFLIIAMDKDTYMLEGGETYYTKAQNIVSVSQNSGSKGWKSFDGSKNRFWLIDNLMNSGFSDIRKCLYNYHINGLDKMWKEDDQLAAKKVINQALMDLRNIYDKRPNAYILQIFFDAKSDEIVNIFSSGPSLDTKPLVANLKLIDAGRNNKYDKIGR